MKVGELLKISTMSHAMTLKDLEEALRAAKELKPVQENAAINTTITATLTLLTVYNLAIEIYAQLIALMPQIKLATKMAGIPLNPAMAAEVAQDALMQAQKMALDAAKQAVLDAKYALLEMEIPGT